LQLQGAALQAAALLAIEVQQPAQAAGHGRHLLGGELAHQRGVQTQACRLPQPLRQPLQHPQHQRQVLQGFGQAAARQQPQPLQRCPRQAGVRAEAAVHEGVAGEQHGALQLLAQIGGGELIAAVDPPAAAAAQAGGAGPGQP
jgi:hypothetical protein